MLSLRLTDFVNTPTGVGRILFFTDYKPVETDGRISIQPAAAVVIYADGSASKFTLDKLTVAEKPQIQPSEPETAIV